ncbi:MAG: hypothetical protein HZC02_04585 [Candidatus Levybacteria bacterium]|nr:hypothetical protein [Candidatus Levybacteria bacterium]
MKVVSYIKDNFLLLLTLFFLVFIPLYPKLPLFDIKHTWVYIRIEDLLVAIAWGVYFVSYFRKKVTLKTPLSLPIIVFWIIGALATLNGILFIFPKLTGVFSSIAILSFFRRVEYLSLFFLAFSAIKNKNAINPIVITLSTTLFGVFAYGIGQRFLGFPAFLTMNEEFAKGIPLRLSALARIPSTFAGHYDLAAYLILLIPIMGSMVFGYKKWYLKIIFLLLATGGLILLLMTASRVSFAVYLISAAFLLVLQKQKKYIIPVFILSILLLKSFTGLSQRFSQTFTQVDLIVDSRTGKAIGVASEIGGNTITIEDKQSTGENLPTGSKYINLPSTKGQQFDSQIIYKKLKPGGEGEEIITKAGKVIVKKAFAYDVSFTTRFQGEWPRAIEAFKRNILFGSGYGSISLATDNSFLRMLGETGILGFFSFILIFIFMGIYLFRTVDDIDDKRIRALIYGVLAGSIGLGLNAILIDVYEASKVAFVLWTVIGVTVGLARLYQKKEIRYISEMKRIFSSTPALVVVLLVSGFLVFSKSLSNYFAGDDFTWLRWAADCHRLLQDQIQQCSTIPATIGQYFTNSEGFFYRPGTRSYFLLAYPVFELFPLPFHVISLLLHLSATLLAFFILKKFLRDKIFGFVGALFFLVLSIHSEAVFWISVTGHMIATNLLFASFLSFLYWKETKKKILFVFSIFAIMFATFFHEFGTTGSFLLIAYDLIYDFPKNKKSLMKKWYYFLLLLPVLLYYLLRSSASSVWFQGDYSYNLSKLPLNVIGNSIGYFITSISGLVFLPYYSAIRTISAQNIAVSALITLAVVGVLIALFVMYKKKMRNIDFKPILIGLSFFIIPLSPFLGLGNLSPRYAYTGSIGVIFLITCFMQSVFLGRKKDNVTSAILAIISIIFIFVHINQLEKNNNEWKKAGDITNSTLVGINYAYANNNSLLPNSTFYFVDTPIKYGDAWVFPQGMEDPLWFSFQDSSLQVKNVSSIEEAIAQTKIDPLRIKAFRFENDGTLVEMNLPTPAPILQQKSTYDK